MVLTDDCRGARDTGRDITPMQRRNLLLGLGSATAASALLGSGAVTELTAERGIAVDVATDANGLIALQSVPKSTNSSKYFNGDGESALIDLQKANLGGGAQGINFDSTAYFDDVFKVVNQSANSVNVQLPVGDDADPSGSQNSDELSSSNFNIELYQGNRAEFSGTPTEALNSPDSDISLVAANSPLRIAPGTEEKVGVKITVPPEDDFSDGNPADQPITGDITLTAQTRESLAENVSDTGASIQYESFDTGTVDAPKIATRSNPDTLDLTVNFDAVDNNEFDEILVEFNNDALVAKSGGNIADFVQADSLNVALSGSSLDVTSVTEASRTDVDGNGESAAILVTMGDRIVSQTDSPRITIDSFLVELEDQSRSTSTEAQVTFQQSFDSATVTTGFTQLNDDT